MSQLKVDDYLEKKPEDPYEKPEECDMVPRYATTIGIVQLSNNFVKPSTVWTGWRSTSTPDPVVPSELHKWKLLSTNTEQIQLLREHETNRSNVLIPSGKDYHDIVYVAIIWTWKRED